MNAEYFPGTILSLLYVLSHLNCSSITIDCYFSFPLFTADKTKEEKD